MRPFWTLVGIRAVFWVGTALTLLWAPLQGVSIPADRAYGALGDLLFGTFEHWDAQWFLHVAKDGYNPVSAAFFPLYPALVHALAWVFRSILVAGTLLSLASAGVAAWALAQIARPLLGDRGARDSVLYLALFPTAFVFTALYSDGLFLALSTASFLAALRGRSWTSGVLGGLAVASRLIGLALLPALLYLLWPRRERQLLRPLPLLLLPAALGLYALYLHYAVGDWMAWRHAQTGWQRESGALGPLTGLWWAIQAGGHGGLQILLHLPSGLAFTPTDRLAFWNAFSLLLFCVAVWLTWAAWRRLGPAFGLYSAATLVVVLWAPSKGFPLVSLPRFLMDDFPIVLALAALTGARPSWRQGLLISFGAATAVAGVAFAHGVWIA
jgi:dolichyl-phosphate-mannose-protein mannosyltransferase